MYNCRGCVGYAAVVYMYRCLCIHVFTYLYFHSVLQCGTLLHTATHCNTLQHTATHCNTLPCIYSRSDTLNLCTTAGEVSGVPQVFLSAGSFTITASNSSGTSSAHIVLKIDSVLFFSLSPCDSWIGPLFLSLFLWKLSRSSLSLSLYIYMYIYIYMYVCVYMYIDIRV